MRGTGVTPVEVAATRHRWWALSALCAGALVISLDATIVNVALPPIQVDLGFSRAALAWVVNSYVLMFAGFRLLSARLGDLLGHRRLFLHGIALFILASLGCALADSQAQLIVARALQGLAGAIVAATALSLILNLFSEDAERAKAIGAYGFVVSAGGTVGLLLGGTVTSVLNWHWIFLINVPIGLTVYGLCFFWLADGTRPERLAHPDIAGAIAVTSSLLLAVYALIGGSASEWPSLTTLALLVGAALMLILFVLNEARAANPLVPPGVFHRQRNLAYCALTNMLSAVAGCTGTFASLYLQLVLKYPPGEVSLLFLPANLALALAAVGLSARLVRRFGIKPTLIGGLLISLAGTLLLAQTSVNESITVNVLPATVLIGLGFGIAGNPMLLAAVSGAEPTESGLISGITSTSALFGWALGFALLARAAAGQTNALLVAGTDLPHALTRGYHVAFYLSAAATGAAAVVSAVFLRREPFDRLQKVSVR